MKYFSKFTCSLFLALTDPGTIIDCMQCLLEPQSFAEYTKKINSVLKIWLITVLIWNRVLYCILRVLLSSIANITELETQIVNIYIENSYICIYNAHSFWNNNCGNGLCNWFNARKYYLSRYNYFTRQVKYIYIRSACFRKTVTYIIIRHRYFYTYICSISILFLQHQSILLFACGQNSTYIKRNRAHSIIFI